LRFVSWTYVNFSTLLMYSSGPRAPTAKLLKVVTNLPKMTSMNGNAIPAAIAVMRDTRYIRRLLLSA
jgi:hypothetical protein